MRDDPPSPPTASRALLLAAAVLLAVVAAMALLVVDGRADEAAFGIVGCIPATVLGARLLAAEPGNRVGSRLLAVGAAFTALLLFDGLERHFLVTLDRPGSFAGRAAAMADDSTWVLVVATLAALVVVFPDGRAATPRLARIDRWMTRLLPVLLFIRLFDGSADLGVEGSPPVHAVSLLPDLSVVVAWVAWPGVGAIFAWLFVAAWSVRRRFRGAHGIERLQLSWLAYGAATIPLVVVLCIADRLIFGDSAGALTVAGLLLPALVIPGCVAVAVLRYRLYEIDRLVNRTLVYVVLTVLLAAAYGPMAVGIGAVLGRGTGWATAAATLVVASAFRPVRDRVQRAVDQRFARRRYLGLRRVEAFLEDVRSGRADPERIGAVLADALDDDGLEVWFRLPATDAWADADGRIGAPPADGVRCRTPVRRGELELGVVLHDPALADTPDTLESVLRAAGLAMEIARLRVEVRVQLAEVQASQARLAVAAEAERRKLERDLHDGAQQRLVALGLALRHAQHVLGADPDAALRTLDGAVGEVTGAVAELRAIARGLRPSLLDAGLGAALTGIAERSPLPVSVEVAAGTLPPDVEATAFYLVSEALTNAVKHSGARRARVRVDHAGGAVCIEVADDGGGGAEVVPGGGLGGMYERVAARGGTVRVESPRGGGTRVIAELPSAS
jgi:signal transduction histidine kinase